MGRLILCAFLAVMTACSTQGPLKPSTGAASEDAGKEASSDATVSKRVPKFGLALGGGAARGPRGQATHKAQQAAGRGGGGVVKIVARCHKGLPGAINQHLQRS